MRKVVVDWYADVYILASILLWRTLLVYLIASGVALNVLFILWWRELH